MSNTVERNIILDMHNQTQCNCTGENSFHKNLRLGYAYVPFQECVGKVYSPERALKEGTIFPELNITIGEYERGLYDGR